MPGLTPNGLSMSAQCEQLLSTVGLVGGNANDAVHVRQTFQLNTLQSTYHRYAWKVRVFLLHIVAMFTFSHNIPFKVTRYDWKTSTFPLCAKYISPLNHAHLDLMPCSLLLNLRQW